MVSIDDSSEKTICWLHNLARLLSTSRYDVAVGLFGYGRQIGPIRFFCTSLRHSDTGRNSQLHSYRAREWLVVAILLTLKCAAVGSSRHMEQPHLSPKLDDSETE